MEAEFYFIGWLNMDLKTLAEFCCSYQIDKLLCVDFTECENDLNFWGNLVGISKLFWGYETENHVFF